MVAAEHRIPVVLASTVLLSFISFWRAAAIVLSDLGSTAYYVGGIAEQAIGKSAPWFILGVMLFSYAVRAIYVESSAMFVRGGVYRVVKEGMGGTLAKLSVSALLFDYVLTGPISAVSAGLYIAGLVNDLSAHGGLGLRIPVNVTAVVVAVGITLYFWWRNTRGLHESSHDALRIMKITTVMIVILIAWCLLTLLVRGGHLPPAPLPRNMSFSHDALGWLEGTRWSQFTAIALLVGFGHSILAMSGEESLAQVYREIEQPKVRNLQKTGFVIFVYSLLFTSLVSFFAVALIPDQVRPRFFDNLISGIAMHLVGPPSVRLVFQAFVVFVGFLILAGAVNTAIVGSNGVLNRVSEDGVLPGWFRRPHRRYGTTYRLINLVAVLQLLTIIASRGNVFVLGEAYAFGVVWSFSLNGLATLVLRFRQPEGRPWKVPGNLHVGGREWPVGLALITAVLFAAAVTNLLTKELATIWGVSFTVVLFTAFTASERATAKRRAGAAARHLDEFSLQGADDISTTALGVHDGNILVPVRDYNTLRHLDYVLDQSADAEVVVMTVRLLQGPEAGASRLDKSEMFTDYEQLVMTRVVAVAERHGRTVQLLIATSPHVIDAVAQTAVRLCSAQIVVGESAKMPAREQARLLGEAWERTPGASGLRTSLVVVRADGGAETYQLGAHAPRLEPEDLALIHQLWMKMVPGNPELRHRDVVVAALHELDRRLTHQRTGHKDHKDRQAEH
ncbi:MAG: APC family permease [Acidobacteriota bacterium]